MPRAQTNGIELEYDTFGSPSDPTVLLISGLGAQMITFYEPFCTGLAERGYHVVRFDNRDVGLSTKIEDGAGYALEDMADDTAGLLDHLGVAAAHVVGVSMGGMIAQTFAINHPDKTLSLCSIMSTTGDRSVGQPTPDAMSALLGAPPQTAEEAADRAVMAAKIIGGKGYPLDEARSRERAIEAWNRNHDSVGFARQLVAIMASGDRTPKLAGVKAPTVVIHGVDDTLVTPSGGEATAQAIPGAELIKVDGMGHDLPVPVWPQVVDAIVKNAEKAGSVA